MNAFTLTKEKSTQTKNNTSMNFYIFKSSNKLMIYIGTLILVIIVIIGFFSQLMLSFSLPQRIGKEILYFIMHKRMNYNQDITAYFHYIFVVSL